ncbi:hypothetical protein IAI18_09145 [Acetobacteraceae bacterium H6797]|nr:hypothetical protein [Acetobacteraceae bacterium H6797]
MYSNPSHMRFSRPIESNGRFIAVAVATESGWRVVPVDPATSAVAEADFTSQAEAIAAARQAIFSRPAVQPR